MASSLIQRHGQLIVLPQRQKRQIGYSNEAAELNRELSHLRGELRFVNDAIAALERLAARRMSEAQPAKTAESLNCGAGRL